MPNYSPKKFRALTWHDATPAFTDGADTPRAYLERCLETIAEREPAVKAFVAMNEPARARPPMPARRGGRPGAALADRRHAHRHQGPARDKGHADRDGLRGL